MSSMQSEQGSEESLLHQFRVRKDNQENLSILAPEEFVEYHGLEHGDQIAYTLEPARTQAQESSQIRLRGQVTESRQSHSRRVVKHAIGNATVGLPYLIFSQYDLLDGVDEGSIVALTESRSPGEFVMTVIDNDSEDGSDPVLTPPTIDLDNEEGYLSDSVKYRESLFNPSRSGPDQEYFIARFYFPVEFNDRFNLSDDTIVYVEPVIVNGQVAARLTFGDEGDDGWDSDQPGYYAVWSDPVRTVDDDTPQVISSNRYRTNFPLFYAHAFGWVHTGFEIKEQKLLSLRDSPRIEKQPLSARWLKTTNYDVLVHKQKAAVGDQKYPIESQKILLDNSGVGRIETVVIDDETGEKTLCHLDIEERLVCETSARLQPYGDSLLIMPANN